MTHMAELGAYREGWEAGQAELMKHYSRSLDEIYALRRALASEARITEAHLTLKTFPKSRHGIAVEQIERMRASARGEVSDAYRDMDNRSMQFAMGQAGMDTCLTRSQWEAEK